MKSTCDNRYSDAPHSCICTPSSPIILLAVHLVALYGICPNYRMNIAGSLMPGVNTRDQLRTMRSQLYPYRRDITVVPPNYMTSEKCLLPSRKRAMGLYSYAQVGLPAEGCFSRMQGVHPASKRKLPC